MAISALSTLSVWSLLAALITLGATSPVPNEPSFATAPSGPTDDLHLLPIREPYEIYPNGTAVDPVIEETFNSVLTKRACTGTNNGPVLTFDDGPRCNPVACGKLTTVNSGYVTASQANQQLNAIDQTVKQLTTSAPVYYRTPYGVPLPKGTAFKWLSYNGWNVQSWDWVINTGCT